MSHERISELRKFQILWMNVVMVLGFTFMSLVSIVGITMRTFWIALSVLLFVQAYVVIVKGKPIMSFLSRKLAELHEHEKIMMGNEWEKQKKVSAGGQAFVGVIALFNAWMIGGEPFVFNAFPDLFFLLIVLMVFMNITVYVQSRKVDRGTVKKGYTLKMLLVSFIIGLVFFGVMNYALLTFIS